MHFIEITSQLLPKILESLGDNAEIISVSFSMIFKADFTQSLRFANRTEYCNQTRKNELWNLLVTHVIQFMLFKNQIFSIFRITRVSNGLANVANMPVDKHNWMQSWCASLALDIVFAKSTWSNYGTKISMVILPISVTCLDRRAAE